MGLAYYQLPVTKAGALGTQPSPHHRHLRPAHRPPGLNNSCSRDRAFGDTSVVAMLPKYRSQR
ncbi:hypothetical protein IG631_14929 [Alternaria alternata]|nr:hypothetical protein IG631_14929 [Alternaria alternata]